MKIRLALVLASVILVLGVGTATAEPTLSVSPKMLRFAPTLVGSFDYQVVTITNNGTGTEHLVTADATNAAFWPTFSGTCNDTYNYYIPPGESCTLQWGFNPDDTGMEAGSGTIYFHSGTLLKVALLGRGTAE